MKKVIVMKTSVDMEMLKKEFEVIKIEDNLNPIMEDYDFLIVGNTLPPKADPNKTILILTEPPHTDQRRDLYEKSKYQFHTVFTFNPMGSHHFNFGDNPSIFPYTPATGYDRIREDTTIKKRGIYWAGNKPKEYSMSSPDCFGSINLVKTRREIAEYLQENYPETTIVGHGWENDTKFVDNGLGCPGWRLQKHKDMDNFNIDFHLCMENRMLKGYVSEKIHDGFSTDRVVLYLGCPNIEKFIPSGSFINLNPLFNKQTKEFDFKQLVNILCELTQEEYDKILSEARKWRKSIIGKWRNELRRHTELIIKRIKDERI